MRIWGSRSPSPGADVTDTSSRPESPAWKPPPLQGCPHRDAAPGPAGAAPRARSSALPSLCPERINPSKGRACPRGAGTAPESCSSARPGTTVRAAHPEPGQAPGALREREYPAASGSPVCRSPAPASLAAAGGGAGQQSPPCRGLRAKRGKFLPTAGRQSPAAPLAAALGTHVQGWSCPAHGP